MIEEASEPVVLQKMQCGFPPLLFGFTVISLQGEPADGEVIVPDGKAEDYGELDEKDMAELPGR